MSVILQTLLAQKTNKESEDGKCFSDRMDSIDGCENGPFVIVNPLAAVFEHDPEMLDRSEGPIALTLFAAVSNRIVCDRIGDIGCFAECENTFSRDRGPFIHYRGPDQKLRFDRVCSSAMGCEDPE